MIALSRAGQGYLARWWWSVDRPVLAAALALMGAGAIMALAAGPAAADFKGVPDPLHFTIRQALFLAPAGGALAGAALLPAAVARRVAIGVFAVSLALMLLVLAVSDPANGATRWLDLGPVSLQPSEFAKPGFVVLAAWLLAEGDRDETIPGAALCFGVYAVFAFILIRQPDYGQFLLVTAAWGATFFVAGLSWAWIGLLGAGAASSLYAAYLFVPHVTKRIDAFLHPETADTFQVDAARAALERGGLFGAGPGEGLVKHRLPDAHTDFIFSVIGEEFGLVACLALIASYAFIVLRALKAASERRSRFQQSAVAGLAALVGAQAVINMGVALSVLPAKGMTLPFISYGGSSLVATAFTVGLTLSLGRDQGIVTRRRESLA